jgi:acetaldehyde dehydrogenase (acetylating)
MGHTMSIHSRNDDIILEFGLKKPAYRIVVNTPTTHGSIGLTTGLDPSMTLGCGWYGGNITSDNISPKHLLNIKRLAYETPPAVVRQSAAPAARVPTQLPRPPASPPLRTGIAAETLARRIDEFLGSRGYAPPGKASGAGTGTPTVPAAREGGGSGLSSQPASTPRTEIGRDERPSDFVCEEDVRQAVRQGRKIVIGERSIVTPAARDLGAAHHVFVEETWRR